MSLANPPRYNEYDDLDSDEEEAERLLSAEHGEAAEDGPTKSSSASRKRSNAPESEADAAAAKEFNEKVRTKKPRPVLEPAQLKGPKGLIFVRRSFPTQVSKFRAPSNNSTNAATNKVIGSGARSNKYAQKLNQNAQIKAAAQYSRSLMSAYRSFAQELFPTLAPQDVFLKIEDLGAKREVKDYLQIMRDELRKEYVERIYGVEKAGRILNELEYGLRQPVVQQDEDEFGDEGVMTVNPRLGHAVLDDEDEEEMGGASELAAPALVTQRAPATNPYRKEPVANTNTAEDATTGNVHEAESVDDEEGELVFKDAGVPSVTAATTADANANEEDEANGANANDTVMQESAAKETETTDEAVLGIESPLLETQEEAVDETAADIGTMKNDDDQSTTLAKTQETLTLVESQFDETESIEEVDVVAGTTLKESQERNTMDEGDVECTAEVSFSQADDGDAAMMEDSQSQEEEDTADERFSQSQSMAETTFSIEEASQDVEGDNDVNEDSTEDKTMGLGQEEPSLEY